MVEQALKRGGTSAFPLNSFLKILPSQNPQQAVSSNQQTQISAPVQSTTKNLLNELLTPISQESTSTQEAVPLLAD